MEKKVFDVLIVYSQHLAKSPLSKSKLVIAPFGIKSKNNQYNEVYGYFMEVSQRNNLKVAFTTSAEIVGAGKCKGYWLYSKNIWTKVDGLGYSRVIFDKFSPTTKKLIEQRKRLFASGTIKPFNDPDIYKLFFDKQKTYSKLRRLSIPTVMIKNSSTKSIEEACESLRNLVKKNVNDGDFSSEVILKDRFGAGGRNIYKFRNDQVNKIRRVLIKKNKKSFIIQPFVNFDKGYKFENKEVSADIRLIYLNGEMIQSYIRMAKSESYLCNEHQGGRLVYINERKVPANVKTLSKNIVEILGTKSLYALDFVVSNNGNPYLLEGNTGPGLDWNPLIAKNVDKAKEFIRLIVKELARMVDRPIIVRKSRISIPSNRYDSFGSYVAFPK